MHVVHVICVEGKKGTLCIVYTTHLYIYIVCVCVCVCVCEG